ncbi:MAG: diacylglycerol/lipid kinase family protein [Pseudomarimonas sp.]
MINSSEDAHQRAATGTFFVVMNGRSGHGDTDANCQRIKAVLDAADRKHEFLLVEPTMLKTTAARAVQMAYARGGIVVAAGGDGTINTVAHAVLGSGVPFAVLPQGTFNYFGRANGIPEDPTAAAQVLVDGRLTSVRVGRLNDRIFLVNASLGLYPKLLETREADKARFGRSRLVAIASALSTLLRSHRKLDLTMYAEHTHVRVRTLALIVGNNRLQLQRIGIEPEHLAAFDRGELIATVLRPTTAMGMLGVILRGALGRVGAAEEVQSFGFLKLSVSPRWRRFIKVGIDGEVIRMRAPLLFSVATEPLWLLTPPPVVDEVAVEPAIEAAT